MPGLQVGFELMGNPDGYFSDWRQAPQLEVWGGLVASVAARYVARYGLEWVAGWRFEPWNEPDHACNLERRLDEGIACDLPSWLQMYEASSLAIASVRRQQGQACACSSVRVHRCGLKIR